MNRKSPNKNSSPSTSTKKRKKLKLDDEFVYLMELIEREKLKFNKHTKIRVDQWKSKLGQPTHNLAWKKSRN